MKTMPKTFTAIADVTAAEKESRTISGTITAFGVEGNGLVLEEGSLSTRTPLSRVKMLIDHDQAQPVGFMTALDMPTASFHIADGEAGDKAIADAKAGVRDGLSIGAKILEAEFDEDREVVVVKSAEVFEVSLCAIPAYADAQVTDIAAAFQPAKETIMANVTPSTAPATPADEVETTTTEVSAAVTPGQAGQAAAPTSAIPRPKSLAMVIDNVAAAVQAGNHAEVRAALADVVPASDAGKGFIRDDWRGELWTADKVDRPLIDALTKRPLGTGAKIKGWRWVDKPKVDTYAGNKTEIPTNEVSTEPAEADVERSAGGWDIDRIFLDLGEPGFLNAFWTAAVADYKRDTEAKTLAKVKAGAGVTTLTSSTLLSGLGEIGAKFAALGASLDALFIAPDLFEEYASMTQAEVPFWLANAAGVSLKNGTASVADLNVRTLPGLAAGEILAIDRRAAEFYEKNPPIQVQAVDLPRGGVDLGLFGYHGTLITDKRAIIAAPLATAGA